MRHDDPMKYLDDLEQEVTRRLADVSTEQQRRATLKRVTFALKLANICMYVAGACLLISLACLAIQWT